MNHRSTAGPIPQYAPSGSLAADALTYLAWVDAKINRNESVFNGDAPMPLFLAKHPELTDADQAGLVLSLFSMLFQSGNDRGFSRETLAEPLSKDPGYLLKAEIRRKFPGQTANTVIAAFDAIAGASYSARLAMVPDFS